MRKVCKMNYQVCYKYDNDKSARWYAHFFEFRVDAVDYYKLKKSSKLYSDVKLLTIGNNK